jgi:hypothetical protein
LPSKNVTVPLGEVTDGGSVPTVAVKVTFWP